jgi:hypothetical protein
MEIRMQRFGEIEVEGERYNHDLVIAQGRIGKRRKGPSKAFRTHFGHTPLSAEEAIPWHGKRLYVGTGMYWALPIMSEVYAAAEEKGIEVIARPTAELCAVLQTLEPKKINAVLQSRSGG